MAIIGVIVGEWFDSCKRNDRSGHFTTHPILFCRIRTCVLTELAVHILRDIHIVVLCTMNELVVRHSRAQIRFIRDYPRGSKVGLKNGLFVSEEILVVVCKWFCDYKACHECKESARFT